MSAETAAGQRPAADMILRNGRIATQDERRSFASAVALKDGRFLVVGTDQEVMPHRGEGTTVIDLGGRTVIPGLNDSHMHPIRGGLNYHLELRWDGVPSLADALRMLREQAQRTPPPQWVRVVGGWTEFQFAERRMPTLDEINAVAPDTPVFVLHLYDRAFLNRAALRAVGYTKDTPNPPGGGDPARQTGPPDGAADRPTECDDPVRDARQRAEALPRGPAQLDAPVHARAEQLRRDQRH
jgi:predicted amidohydrolase YtcJ